ncbi:biotin carboxyl carrier protein of acetyl-CoA carboxylase-like isoform X2 [Dioscorea cayenensis subsp. rotundata]|uniref:Biotin carboxyl carrier protein of acetyl-CoA carboxylase-like isoform X2 n=1 Tax=Dioscorea cayennensis subsp. rotundata TaxID=55577 RepID=A0AB40C781_DIOCR|nr:biotin carboxyl carrier protein of acetyl-CoA carboxylase-like isoform X2 [Dioscorea cayenensis subsp. rotundata]
MGTTPTLRSLHGALWGTPQMQSSLNKPVGAPLQTCSFRNESFFKTSFLGQSLRSSNMNKRMPLLPYVKASEAASEVASDNSLTKSEQSSSTGENVQKSAFPNGFERLILELCDETTVAELKLKIGGFEMYVRRDISSSNAQIPTIPPNALPIQAPPIPSKPMSELGPLAPPAVPQKPPRTPSSPFINVPSAKDAKLAALEDSGAKTYVIVASPTVGSFRRARTLKGKRQPPSCKEGDMIKEGQVIGYLDQFGNELPIRSDVAGEVLKILYQDGEAVGFGDPLIAVLPAFPGIN